jgi:uncharacterized membrane protein YqaE (UPF0057 family)
MRILFASLIAIVSLTYLMPFAIAVGRKRTNTGAIFVLNLFLGWTLVGWVVALVWACAHDDVRANRATV